MHERATLGELIQQLKNDSHEAFEQIVERFGPVILREIRRRLHADVRRVVDSADVQQAVLKSLWDHRAELGGEDGPRSLGKFLAIMARNKVLKANRFQLQQRRTARTTATLAGDRIGEDRRRSRPPTASTVAMARETMERLERHLGPQRIEIVRLSLAGESLAAIAQRVGVSQRTVQRVLGRVAEVIDADD